MADSRADPLCGLDEVNWASLEHAYGAAGDVPQYLRRLAAPDLTKDDLENLHYTFYSNIHHQGSRYSSSVAAVPFLLALLASPTTLGRDKILQLLVHLAISDPATQLCGFNISQLRENVVQIQAPGYAEEEQRRRDEWVADAKDDAERKSREADLVFRRSVDRLIKEQLVELQVYEAVMAGLPTIRQCLEDESAAVRAWAAYALAWFPEEIETSSQLLFAAVEREQDAAVRGTALLSLAVLQAPNSLPSTPASRGKVGFSETPIAMRLAQIFGQENSGDLTRFCCALGLSIMGLAGGEHVPVILRKLSDKTFLENFEPNNLDESTVFPFANPNLVSLACFSLGGIKGSEHPSVPLALAAALLTETSIWHSVTPTALRTAFDGTPLALKGRELPPFNTLTEPQQAVVLALTHMNTSNWRLMNFFGTFRAWGLPSELAELQKYAGVGPTVPSTS